MRIKQKWMDVRLLGLLLRCYVTLFKRISSRAYLEVNSSQEFSNTSNSDF